MKRSSYFLLFLVVIILVVAYLYIKPTDSQEFTYEKPDIDLTFDIAKISKVEVEHNKQYIRFEKIRNRWKIIDPINAYADDEAMFGLLEGLAKFKLLGLISTSAQKQSLYEVDEKGTNVTITTDDNKSTMLVVGKVGQTSGQTYVRPASSGSVYIAKGIVPALVNKSLGEWRQRTVYRVEPRQMKMITLRSGGGRVVFRRDDKKWVSNGATVSAKVMKPAVQALSSLRAEGFIDTIVFLSGSPVLHAEIMADELIKLDFYSHPKFKNQYLLKSSTDPKLFAVKRSAVQEISNLVGSGEASAGEEFVSETTSGTEINDAYQPPAGQQDGDVTPQARAVLQSILQQSSTRSGVTEGLAAGTGIEDTGELTVYTVKSGDNVQSICRKFNVSEEQMRRWNILKPTDAVKPGMELYVYIVR